MILDSGITLHVGIDDTDSYPEDLNSAFRKYFQRYFPDRDKYDRLFRLPLGIIAACGEPIPAEELDTVRAYFTTIEHDTVAVDVPIEHKVYQEDSLYRCEISGYIPNLESLTIYPTITTITIREKVKTPPPKLSLGITAGPSALVSPSGKIHGGIGATVGLQYRF